MACLWNLLPAWRMAQSRKRGEAQDSTTTFSPMGSYNELLLTLEDYGMFYGYILLGLILTRRFKVYVLQLGQQDISLKNSVMG